MEEIRVKAGRSAESFDAVSIRFIKRVNGKKYYAKPVKLEFYKTPVDEGSAPPKGQRHFLTLSEELASQLGVVLASNTGGIVSSNALVRELREQVEKIQATADKLGIENAGLRRELDGYKGLLERAQRPGASLVLNGPAPGHYGDGEKSA